MSVGDAADGNRRIDEASAPGLEWISDRDSGSPRVTVFDPRPGRLDTAWIEIDGRSTVALRAMR